MFGNSLKREIFSIFNFMIRKVKKKKSADNKFTFKNLNPSYDLVCTVLGVLSWEDTYRTARYKLFADWLRDFLF